MPRKLHPFPKYDEQTLLNFADLARYLGISETTARGLATADDFPRRRQIGNRLYFLREEIAAWVSKRPQVERVVNAAS